VRGEAGEAISSLRAASMEAKWFDSRRTETGRFEGSSDAATWSSFECAPPGWSWR
jgi:hypothetical protein